MLVLTRRIGEELVIGENIRVSVVRVEGGKVRLGVVAPRSVRVQREEVLAKQLSDVLGMPGLSTAGSTATQGL